MEHNDNPAPEQDDTDQNFLQTSQGTEIIKY